MTLLSAENYLELSEVTEKKFPHGLIVSADQHDEITDLLDQFVALAAKIDALKKRVIYADTPDADSVSRVWYQSDESEMLHSALGIAGEAGEVVAAIRDWNGNNSEVVEKEIGDLQWYIAIAIRRLKSSFGQVFHKNIDKLAKRYPEGFSNAAAWAKADDMLGR